MGESLFPDQSLRYGLILDGSLGNLANHGDGNSNGYSKLNPSSIPLFYFTNYCSTAFIPSALGTPQAVGVIILYSFVQLPEILAEGAGGTSGDNATSGVK